MLAFTWVAKLQEVFVLVLSTDLHCGKLFHLAPTPGFSWWQAGLAELLYTFMLCFVVLNVACSKKHAGNNQSYGLAIGFVVVAGGYGAGHISGGCLNPAAAIGIDVSSAGLGFGWCFLYTIFGFIGAALAAVAFRVCRPEEKKEDAECPADYEIASKVVSEFLGTYFALGTFSGAHLNPGSSGEPTQ